MTTEEYKEAANFWKIKERKEMPMEQIQKAVEAYLCSSTVCALATGAGDYVRCTPLEYSFMTASSGFSQRVARNLSAWKKIIM